MLLLAVWPKETLAGWLRGTSGRVPGRGTKPAAVGGSLADGGERLSSSSSAAISSGVREVRWLSGASSSSSRSVSGGGGAVEMAVCDIIGSRASVGGGGDGVCSGRGTAGRPGSDGEPPGRGIAGGGRKPGAAAAPRLGIDWVVGGGR